MQKTLYRTLIIISIAVLIAMIGRSQDEYKTEEKSCKKREVSRLLTKIRTRQSSNPQPSGP